jgi:predicted dehydrogenase
MALQLAFYGAGERAQPYLDALAHRADVHVTAVCDLNRRAAEQTAAGWGARVYLSYEAMLEQANPDVLWICVAPHLQGDIILRAAQRKMPFFVEPPGAVDYEHARVYGQLVAEGNLVTAVGFCQRHADVVREAREYLGANPIPLALGWWLCPPAEEGPPASQPPQAPVTVLLWTDACRLVDALRCFCGEVTRVRALTAGAGNTAGGLVVQLEFARGTVGVLTCAAFARPEPRVELELLGEGWSMSFGPALSSLRLAEHDKTTILRCLNVPAADQMEAFLNAVIAGTPGTVLVSYGEALRTLAVCQAANVSAQEDRAVTLTEISSQGEQGV